MKPPPLLSEDTGVPPWTGCTFCSAVMMASYGGISLPLGVTTAEHYALVRAAGKVPGHEAALLSDVQKGYAVRYGVQAHLFQGSIADLKALGDVYALVQGNYADLPPHYRRWDPSFTGIHAAGYMPPIAWWQDPLARQREIMAGFNGESMAMGVLDAYALGYGGSIHALYLRANEFSSGAGPSDPVVSDVIYSRGGLVTALVKAGTPYAREPAGPTVATIPADTRFLIAAFDAGGQWCAIDGNYLSTQSKQTVPMGWITTAEVFDIQNAITTTPPTATSATIAFSDGTTQKIG